VSRRGFSLVEVLVAMVILSLGATSILALYASAAATHRRSVDRTRAALVAEEVLAQVQSHYLPGSGPADLEASLRESLPASIDGYTWQVFFIRPGAESDARGGKPAGGTVSSKDAGKKAAAAPPPAASRKAAGAKAGSLSAPPGAARRSGSRRSEESDAPAYTEEELVVRVVVRWLQSGRSLSETFDTILLPRPITLPSRAGHR
jgi:prepilin-type N-terminal cleavage/methylation domain-containing protein